MSTFSQFTGGQATKQIANHCSVSGYITPNFDVSATSSLNNAREVLSGALTANTLKTLLTVTGSGCVPYLTAYTKNATTRTVRAVVIVDGVTVFDSTSAVITATNRGAQIAGCATWNGGGLSAAQGEPIRFSSSLVVQVASSLTETDFVAIAYQLN